MAATVVSVVIFLCGVLVGRGVTTERATTSADAPASPTLQIDAITAAPTAAPPAGSDPTTAAPPPTVDDFIYFNRLEKQTQLPEACRLPPLAAPTSAPPPWPAPAAANRNSAARVSDRTAALALPAARAT